MYNRVSANTDGVNEPNIIEEFEGVFSADPAAFVFLSKAVLLDHAMPSYSSFHAVIAGACPPEAIAEFCVPDPAVPNLALSKGPPAAQDEPSYSSLQERAG